MATIRVFAPADIPQLVALFERMNPDRRWRSPAACEQYFHEMLLASPWRDLNLPSWIAEEDGRVRACFLVLPKLMRFHRRSIRVAVGCQAMVDPGPGRMAAALQLAKAVFQGPQDLTIADGSNDGAQRAWKCLGGAVSLLNSLYWTRPLLPARHALGLLRQRSGAPGAILRAARPIGAAIDALASYAGPNRFLRKPAELLERPLDAELMLAHSARLLRGYALQPEYDRRSLAWTLEQAARKTGLGRLNALALFDANEKFVGWYLAYTQSGAACTIIQLAAAPGAFDRVLRHLLARAWRDGASVVHGRLEARYAKELSSRHCWLRTDGTWTLAQSRDPEITSAIMQGDAYLSRLDGEWLLGFHDEGMASAEVPKRASSAPAARCALGMNAAVN